MTDMMTIFTGILKTPTDFNFLWELPIKTRPVILRLRYPLVVEVFPG
jgi:hypothetical protein